MYLAFFLILECKLLKYDTVKTTWNHPSGTWGRCWTIIRWSCQKTIWFYLFYEFLKCVYRAMYLAFFLIWECNYLKDDTVKQHENHPVVLGEMLNNNQVEFAENNLILLFYEFLKCSIEQCISIFLDFGMQLLKRWYSKTTWISSQWYLGEMLNQ